MNKGKVICPRCGFDEFYCLSGGAGAELITCAKCRALLRRVPLGRIDFVADDASERFPEILEWWQE